MLGTYYFQYPIEKVSTQQSIQLSLLSRAPANRRPPKSSAFKAVPLTVSQAVPGFRHSVEATLNPHAPTGLPRLPIHPALSRFFESVVQLGSLVWVLDRSEGKLNANLADALLRGWNVRCGLAPLHWHHQIWSQQALFVVVG